MNPHPMLANELDNHAAKYRGVRYGELLERGFLVQPKYDGVWVCITHDGRVWTRNGKPVTSLPPDLIDRHTHPHLVVIAEALVLGEPFAVTSGAVRRKTPGKLPITLRVHDTVDAERFRDGEEDDTPYETRWEETKILFPETSSLLLDIGSEERLLQSAREYAEMPGFDGLMLKDPKGRYLRKRSTNLELIKVKPLATETFRVLDVHVGLQGKGTKLGGALVLDLGDGLTCKVGTGFSKEELESMEAAPESWLGKHVEVASMGRHPTGGLREPRYLGVRCE